MRTSQMRRSSGNDDDGDDDDSVFDLEWSHIKFLLAEGQQVANLGNALLRLLRSAKLGKAAPIRVTSPRRGEAGEFSVAATVCRGLYWCELKVSFWAEGPQEYVAEFQHTGGDERAFLQVFGLAYGYYKEQDFGCKEEEEEAVASLGDDTEMLAPNGDVAHLVYVPDDEGMQEDSALALARIAEDPVEQRHLCDARICEKVRKLTKSDILGVAWPTARLLAALATGACSKSEPVARFLEDIRIELREKTYSDFTEAAVQELLWETFFRGDGGERPSRL